MWSSWIGNPDLDAQVEIGGLKKLADPESSNSVITSEAVPAIWAIDLYPELYLQTPILWSISVQSTSSDECDKGFDDCEPKILQVVCTYTKLHCVSLDP